MWCYVVYFGMLILCYKNINLFCISFIGIKINFFKFILIFIRLNLYFVVLIMIIFYFIDVFRFGGGLEEDDVIFSRVFKIIK